MNFKFWLYLLYRIVLGFHLDKFIIYQKTFIVFTEFKRFYQSISNASPCTILNF